jgi:hypothetical protein
MRGRLRESSQIDNPLLRLSKVTTEAATLVNPRLDTS